ncbi:MAG: TraB/GumN family protein [Gammaproteobacteria bacterium]|nr:TraB/GumN family protein [Gammaproteobacteria bacterium]|tara:strand:- start:94378 stop:95241 length:864 start_codon:yes stop_codon:yes gene_type:complete
MLPILKRLSLVLLLVSQSLLAQTSVWQASNGENTVYLAGTVHMLRAADYPLPAAFDQAYAQADALYFEINIDDMNAVGAQMTLMEQLMYTDGRNIESVLSPEAYDALTTFTADLGVPMMILQNMKPGMLVSTLEILSMQQLGFTPQGVDMYFHQRAKADGKAIAGFETVEQQIDFLAGMGVGEESEFIMMSLEELEKISTDIEVLVGPWRSGNTQQMNELFVESMKNSAPDAYDLLMASRNLDWMPEIEAMFEDADTELVLVGVAHLIGEDGLIQMLENRGYRLNQL